MDDNRSASGGSLTLPIIFGVVGYFVYANNFSAALGVFLYAISLSIAAIFGLIPVVGMGIYIWIANSLGGWILGLTGVVAGTLTMVMFWLYFVLAIILGIFVLIAVNKQ